VIKQARSVEPRASAALPRNSTPSKRQVGVWRSATIDGFRLIWVRRGQGPERPLPPAPVIEGRWHRPAASLLTPVAEPLPPRRSDAADRFYLLRLAQFDPKQSLDLGKTGPRVTGRLPRPSVTSRNWWA